MKLRRPVVLVVHRENSASSTEEPLDLELERITYIVSQPTCVEVPTIPESTETDVFTTGAPAWLTELRQQQQEDLDEETRPRMPALEDAFLLDRSLLGEDVVRHMDEESPEVETELEPVEKLIQETVHILPGIVTFQDKKNRLDINTLCQRAITKFQRKHGVLPTHVIVNSMRLISERPADQWEIFALPNVFGALPIKLRGMKNCSYNVARCIVEQEESIKVA